MPRRLPRGPPTRSRPRRPPARRSAGSRTPGGAAASNPERSPDVTRAAASRDKWHLDELVISVAGKKHWLWRAVDQDGFVLDVLVQSRRDKEAAKRLFRKLLKKQGRAPRVLVTDKLKSYAAAKREIMPGVEHRQHKGLNNRAENSHQPPTQTDHEAVQVAAARSTLPFRS